MFYNMEMWYFRLQKKSYKHTQNLACIKRAFNIDVFVFILYQKLIMQFLNKVSRLKKEKKLRQTSLFYQVG